MSIPVRQSNLFAAEDFLKIFRSFKQVDFTAYDFDSIREALVDYIKEQYPEDFNDFIESSEYIAIIELLAYLGTSLALRTDLNSRENFLDTAERRESIIRLARMLSYNPKRNIPARGVFKIFGVQTNEPIRDSLGRDLQDTPIFWNDANNPDGFEQFTTVLNAAFISTNPFGRPVKSSSVGGIPTDLYQIDNSELTSLVYPVAVSLPEGSRPVDVVNPDITTEGTFVERHPDPANAFHIIYRNDSNGLDSENTGFFVHFRQGKLESRDFQLDFPIENRVINIDSTNINEFDVYVQEIDLDGNVVEKWTRVPSLAGNNIAFNDLELDVRKIYDVVTDTQDRVKLKFSDGNFGEIPRGLIRVWYRRSANSFLTIRPENASNLQISMPYVGSDGKTYLLNLFFGLESTISNSAPSETDEDIKLRAPQVFYTQNRMVNSEDYNVFPLSRGNEITKIRAINRTHAGHSRFIDINDPTGSTQNVILFAEDGVIYKESESDSLSIELIQNIALEEEITENLEEFLRNQKLNNWYYDVYLKDFIRNNPDSLDFSDETIRWKTAPNKENNDTGYFLQNGTNITQNPEDFFDDSLNLSIDDYSFIEPGAYLRFYNPDDPLDIITTAVKSVINSGLPNTTTITTIGPVELSREIPNFWILLDVLPAFQTTFDASEAGAIQEQMELQNDFAIGYDAEEGSWYIIPSGMFDLTGDFDLTTRGTMNDTSWLIHADFQAGTGSENAHYIFTTRGTRYLFSSNKEVRFFNSPEQRAIDIETGRAVEDEIVLLDLNSRKNKEIWSYSSTTTNWQFNAISVPNSSMFIPLQSRNSTLANTTIRHYNTISMVDYGLTFLTVSFGRIMWTVAYSPVDGDVIEITYDNQTRLESDIIWNIHDSFVLSDGHLDQTKVEIKPIDRDEDGVPDFPLSFDSFVDEESDRVYFERFVDFDGYQYFRPWVTGYADVQDPTNVSATLFTVDGFDIQPTGLFIFATQSDLLAFIAEVESVSNASEQLALAKALEGKIVYVESTDIFYDIPLIKKDTDLLVGETNFDNFQVDVDHIIRVGRSFELNAFEETQDSLWFKWKHFAPRANRIDPSVSNIIDMYVLTTGYLNEVQLWKDDNRPIDEFPETPTTEELRTQFSDLNQFKMISDEIIYKPAKYKILFGSQAIPELRAKFKVVKIPTITISDNEIKSRVISAIDEYFNIQNWDFGESFYYTELSAFIHQKLANVIATVVIVPTKTESQFGDLFQIKAEADELFLSTATVADVEVIENLTDVNLRTK